MIKSKFWNNIHKHMFVRQMQYFVALFLFKILLYHIALTINYFLFNLDLEKCSRMKFTEKDTKYQNLQA